MKITDIKSFPVWVGTRNQLLVKVETDEGIYGWGESGLSSREFAVAGVVSHYREWLIGRDPMRRGSLWQEMYRSQYFEGGRALTAAISAIDIALYDIVGKKLGVPVYDLSRRETPGFRADLRHRRRRFARRDGRRCKANTSGRIQLHPNAPRLLRGRRREPLRAAGAHGPGRRKA